MTDSRMGNAEYWKDQSGNETEQLPSLTDGSLENTGNYYSIFFFKEKANIFFLEGNYFFFIGRIQLNWIPLIHYNESEKVLTVIYIDY